MKRNEFRDRAYKTFISGWGVVTPFGFDNEKFDPPQPPTKGSQEGVPWVRLTVRHQNTEQISLGPVGFRKFEHQASLILQIFTVPNTGMKKSDELAQLFFEIFDEDMGRNDVFGGESSYRERGTAEGWQMSEARVEYTYHETR